MDVVCIANCEDCGKFPVLGSELVTIIKLRDEYQIAMVCAYCERPIVDDIDVGTMKKLKFKDVRMLDWIIDANG